MDEGLVRSPTRPRTTAEAILWHSRGTWVCHKIQTRAVALQVRRLTRPQTLEQAATRPITSETVKVNQMSRALRLPDATAFGFMPGEHAFTLERASHLPLHLPP